MDNESCLSNVWEVLKMGMIRDFYYCHFLLEKKDDGLVAFIEHLLMTLLNPSLHLNRT